MKKKKKTSTNHRIEDGTFFRMFAKSFDKNFALQDVRNAVLDELDDSNLTSWHTLINEKSKSLTVIFEEGHEYMADDRLHKKVQEVFGKEKGTLPPSAMKAKLYFVASDMELFEEGKDDDKIAMPNRWLKLIKKCSE